MSNKFPTTNHCIRWGRHVDLKGVCQHALLPVPVALSDMKVGMVLANTISANIYCTNKIDCEGTTCMIVINRHALVRLIGKPADAKTLGDLGDTFSEAVIHLGQSHQRIVIIFDRYRRE